MTSRPNPIDVHVGSRVRLRRTSLGMSQEKLGEALGLTFQQVQKYERGTNRIGASRLYHIGRVLDVSVTYFFDDMPSYEVSRAGHGLADGDSEIVALDPTIKRETLELVRAYYRIGDAAARKRLFELAKAIANVAAKDYQQ